MPGRRGCGARRQPQRAADVDVGGVQPRDVKSRISSDAILQLPDHRATDRPADPIASAPIATAPIATAPSEVDRNRRRDAAIHREVRAARCPRASFMMLTT